MKFLLIPFFLILNLTGLLAQPKAGLIYHGAGTTDGYILFSTLNSRMSYLVDKCGKLVHSWSSATVPGQSCYLLPDGTLLRSGNDVVQHFKGMGSAGGKIERFDWNNKLIWSYTISDETKRQHHDIQYMPNGHILVLVWHKKTYEAALAAGSDSLQYKTTGIWTERILEIKPIGKDSAVTVWEWDSFDHIIQDYDKTKKNFGVIKENPQLLDLNFIKSKSTNADWLHFNSIDYNPALDQIMVSSRSMDEIYIIDHSTTKAQAASHKGGKQNKGGDILYRWGNPSAYQCDTMYHKQLFAQHHAHWIEKGLPDEGKIMIFNNEAGNGENYSSVDVITPPVDKTGRYALKTGEAFLPLAPSWRYIDKEFLYSKKYSSAQRLPNGNTVICEGESGTFFEIDSTKKIVWIYGNPVAGQTILTALSSSHETATFRCYFYPPNYPGLKNHLLTPGEPIEREPIKMLPCR